MEGDFSQQEPEESISSHRDIEMAPRFLGNSAYMTRYPSGTLFLFLFWGLFIKIDYQDKVTKGTNNVKGLLGNLDEHLKALHPKP